MAGLSSLIVLAFAGSLLGLGMIFIFPFIHWSYRLVNLTNLIIVISCMESLGLPVGNSFTCSSPLYPLSRTVFFHIGCCHVCFLVLLDMTYSTYVPLQLVLSGPHLDLTLILPLVTETLSVNGI